MTWTPKLAQDAVWARYQADRRRRDREKKRRMAQLMREYGMAPVPQEIVPPIRMIVSPWFVDELGNRCRTIQAAD